MARNVTYSVAPRIHFRPGTTLAGMLSNLTFAKVAVKYTKDEEEDEVVEED